MSYFHNNYSALLTINNIRFTAREADIIAFVLSGRSVKSIAVFLCISPKTVEAHLRNVMLKLECNSQERIINFIEEANKFTLFRQHYIYLMSQLEFIKILASIGKFIGTGQINCLVIYDGSHSNQKVLFEQLRDHLKAMNICLHISKHYAFWDTEALDNISDPNIKNIIDFSGLDPLYDYGNIIKLPKFQYLKKSFSIKTLFILSNTKDIDSHKNADRHFNFINVNKYNDYFDFFFELIKNILEEYDISQFQNKFIEQRNDNIADLKDVFSVTQKSQEVVPTKDLKSIAVSSITEHKNWFILSLILILAGLYYYVKGDRTLDSNTYDNVKTKIVRSDLPLPQDVVLLKRSHLIKKISDKFNNFDKIQIIALIGLGGSGKTTSARYYADLQQCSVIWELNAENKETLAESFEKLAYSLVQTNEETLIVKNLQEIQNFQDKTNKILSFVKSKLRASKKWLLIYDNAVCFNGIEQYIPLDKKTWGVGQVIMTSQDSNIALYNYIQDSLFIKELTDQEKYHLFTCVIKQGNYSNKLMENEMQVKSFLKSIPSFPLDVSVAAHYIKATQISYDCYLSYLNDYNKDFEQNQQYILNDISDYKKTRFSLIALALNSLMYEQKSFIDLLLLISIIDHNNIPIHIIQQFTNDIVANNFIYFLKKYSLVVPDNDTSKNDTKTFSIHKSTQEIILNFLAQKLNIHQNSNHLTPVLTIFENDMTRIINLENSSQIKLMVNHCRSILGHHNLINHKSALKLKVKLGILYHHLSHYDQSNAILQQALQQLTQAHSNDDAVNFDIHMYLGLNALEFGHNQQALSLLNQAYSIYHNKALNNDVSIALVLDCLGRAHKNLGNTEKSVSLLTQSLTILQRKPLQNQTKVAWILTHLGNIYTEQGYYEKAQNVLESSLKIYQNVLPSDHIKIARALIYLGDLYLKIGKYHEAKKVLLRSYSIYQKNFSKDHSRMAQILKFLGKTYFYLEDYKQAISMLEESLRIYKTHLSQNHPRIAWNLSYLGEIHTQLGSYQQAQSLLESSINIYEKILGRHSIKCVKVIQKLGQNYLKLGQLLEAEKYIIEALKVLSETKQADAFMCLESLGDIYVIKAQQQKDNLVSQRLKLQAQEYFKTACSTIDLYFPKNSVHYLRIENKLQKVS